MLKNKFFMKKIVLGLVLIASISSCVSTKKYQELDDKYIKARSENVELKEQLDTLSNNLLKCQSKLDRLQIAYDNMKNKYETLDKLYTVKENAYKKLQASYDALSQSSSQTLAYEAEKSKKLLSELEKKQAELAKEREELDKRSQKIEQLESLIAQKDAKLNNLKSSLNRALTSFKGQGLKITQRDGKIYISMENKLLFDSGSWHIKQNGRDAIKTIANILSINPDVEIMIEGHTDNVPYRGKGAIQDNWDLSVKRATSVVRQLMKNEHIDPKRLIPAGRSKYLPVADNSTPEGRAKNRRIEVILTPRLDQIMNLLNNNDTDKEQN
jgi:chemotaxis protein MotB